MPSLLLTWLNWLNVLLTNLSIGAADFHHASYFTVAMRSFTGEAFRINKLTE
ncbi:unnamed protein product [Camellia sinensis]